MPVVRRYLTASEALSYIAHQEQSADHCTILANVYQDCIALLPPLPKPADATAAADGGGAAAAAAEPKADAHRRHYLALIAQRAWQIVQRAVTRGAADGSLDEAWGMLSRAAVSFRRCGSLGRQLVACQQHPATGAQGSVCMCTQRVQRIGPASESFK